MNFEAKYKAMGGGLMIGMQWLIKNRVSIDWWIIGFHGGSATPSISVTGSDFAALDAEQQYELEHAIEEVGVAVPFASSSVADVNSSGATLTLKMPYLGLRSGLCIGIAF